MGDEQHKYTVSSTDELHRGKWLRFVQRQYTHRDGHVIKYESVDRLNVPANQAAAVVVVAMHANCIVLVKQFRAPVNAYVLELPSGMIESGESVEQAALRELREETGFSGTVTSVTGSCAAECSITSADEAYAFVTCSERGQQKLDADEDIQVLTAPINQLQQLLQSEINSETVICTRLQALVLGMQMHQQFTAVSSHTQSRT